MRNKKGGKKRRSYLVNAKHLPSPLLPYLILKNVPVATSTSVPVCRKVDFEWPLYVCTAALRTHS